MLLAVCGGTEGWEQREVCFHAYFEVCFHLVSRMLAPGVVRLNAEHGF